jgi:hypothetical protein
MEVPAGTTEAPACVAEVPLALKEEEAGLIQFEVGRASSRASLISRGSVDSVFWYTKHVHYTLVWI